MKNSPRSRAIDALNNFFTAKNPAVASYLNLPTMQESIGRLVDSILEAAAPGPSAIEKAAKEYVDAVRARHPGENFSNPFMLKLIDALDTKKASVEQPEDPELTISLGDAESALRNPQMVGAIEAEFVGSKLTALKFKCDCAVLHVGKGVRIFDAGKTYRVVADDNCQHNCQHHPVLDAIFPVIQPKN